jgi:hypothetical protein
VSSRRRALATLVSVALVLVGVGQLPATGASPVVTGYELRVSAPEPGTAYFTTSLAGVAVRGGWMPVGPTVTSRQLPAVPGDYTVEFYGDYLTQTVAFTVVEGSVTLVVVGLVPDVGLAGRLVDDVDGSPIALEPVHVERAGGSGFTRATGIDGTFSFWRLDPGTYTLSLPVREGFTPLEVVVENDVTTHVGDISLERLTHITVQLDVRDDAAIVDVKAYRVVDGVPQPGAIAPDWPVRLTVDPGTYLVVAADANRQHVAPVRRLVTVTRGENATVPVVMSLGAPITGSVVDGTYHWAGEVGIRGNEVSCSTGAALVGPAYVEVWTNSRSDGTFVLPATPGSCYDLTTWWGEDLLPEARGVRAGTTKVVVKPLVAETRMTFASQGAPYGTPVVLRTDVRVYSPTGRADLVAVGGTVTFRDGERTLGTATVSSRGVAAISVRGLGIGSHDIEAYYSGTSTTYQSMTSSQVWVSKAYPKLTTVASNLRRGYGATVAIVVSGPCIPTGTVTAYHNGAPVGTVAVKRVRGGYAGVMTTARLRTPGDITVSYTGNWCMESDYTSTPYWVR